MDFLERKQSLLYGAMAIPYEEARQKETSRIEGEDTLGVAVNHLYLARHGKLPGKEVLARLVESIQIIFAETRDKPSSERDARLDRAYKILKVEA